MNLRDKIKTILKDNAKLTLKDDGIDVERYYDKDAESMEKLLDEHAIGFAEWMHENTVYSGNGFYTSFIPKHNNCQFNLIQLIKLYNQSFKIIGV